MTEPQPILLKNCKIVDVNTISIQHGDILVNNGIIQEINPQGTLPQNIRIIDLQGKYVSPGFIESHMHIESSMMPPLEFAHYSVKHGTTTMLVDPHEIANVAGMRGIQLWLDQAQQVPMDIFIGIPSCVPATNMEHSGAEISLKDIRTLINNNQIYGLGEMMNFPGIIYDLGDARKKVDVAYNFGKLVDGHCPGLSGEELKTYISNGFLDGQVRIMMDHECTSADEVREKLNAGMYIALRYGSATRDLDSILPELLENHVDLNKCLLCSDDLSSAELLEHGHVDRIIKRTRDIFMQKTNLTKEQATIQAISMATRTPGNYLEQFLNLTHRPPTGQISLNYQANLIVFDSLEDMDIISVIHDGEFVFKDGRFLHTIPEYDYSDFLQSVRITQPFSVSNFVVPYSGSNKTVNINVIQTTPISLLTEKVVEEMEISEIHGIKHIKTDLSRDLLKIAVFERHNDTGFHSIGFIKGIGIKSGAIASTVAHDSHNLIVIGTDDESMMQVANFMKKNGGGMVAYTKDKIVHFPLPIGGIMSTDPIEKIVEDYSAVKAAAQEMGSPNQNVFMTMSFMALPVIPHLKITDMGLIDVDQFHPIDLILEN